MSKLISIFCLLFVPLSSGFAVQIYAFILNENSSEFPDMTGLSIGYLNEAERYVPLVDAPGMLSEPVILNKVNSINLYIGRDGKAVALLEKKTISESAKRILLIFVPMPSGRPFRVFPLDMSKIDLTKNEVLGLNLTAKPLALRINNDKAIVQPGGYISSTLIVSDSYRAPMQVLTKGSKGWELIYSQRTVVSPNRNQLKVIYRSFLDGSWQISDIRFPENGSQSERPSAQ